MLLDGRGKQIEGSTDGGGLDHSLKRLTLPRLQLVWRPSRQDES